MTPILARCGYRCDLCPAYRGNIHGPEDQQRVSDGWFKYYGFRIAPESIGCDGCLDDRPEACRIDAACPVRSCSMTRGFETCAVCPKYGCDDLDPRAVSRQSVEQRFGGPISEDDYQRFVLPYEGRARLDAMREPNGR